MKHELKCWTSYFQRIVAGVKNFEVRKNDRNYMIGDILYLREWDNLKQDYTGAWIEMRVTYILNGGQFGVESGHCVMSLAPVD